MRNRHLLLNILVLLTLTACVQITRDDRAGGSEDGVARSSTIEGYWQDAERRVLFARGAPPSSVYGKWISLDPQQTYPLAKQIRRTASNYELIDLNYDSNYAIKILNATDRGIEFVRSPTWTACGMHHACRLEGAGLICSIENRRREAGAEVVDWRGEERYVRRAHCERVGRTEAQGIPVRCR